MRESSRPLVFRGCPGSFEPAPVVAAEGPVAFLDRDGVINIDKGYVNRVEDFEFVDGAERTVELLKSRGHHVVVVTNQSGIGRGLYSEDDFLRLTHWLSCQISLDGVCYCPHSPEANCPARKPGTRMLETASRVFRADKSSSFLIGDKETDIQAASNFGMRGLLFGGGNLFDFIKFELGG